MLHLPQYWGQCLLSHTWDSGIRDEAGSNIDERGCNDKRQNNNDDGMGPSQFHIILG